MSRLLGARPCHVVQTHVPTGATYAGDFNRDQSVWFEDWRHLTEEQFRREAGSLVAQWNRMCPDTWAYALAEGPAPPKDTPRHA